ncbi:hypothetical protein RHMOL_Rhmol11G0220100 [Rhododendron molle]|uniref:Uncharacterized protein n=1 Tax=Rhododendron molle TaxID=49168 RepID=A0ACC0LVX5_RHOML|nr:hypothetical protein RHMOL_Rhmol11G0220100 [Rhododendron molle]
MQKSKKKKEKPFSSLLMRKCMRCCSFYATPARNAFASLPFPSNDIDQVNGGVEQGEEKQAGKWSCG